jgi:hypothetical protein
MSYQCVKWVLQNSKARGGARNVLLALAEHASEDGTDSYPGVATLSHESQVTERQIHKLLRSLERGAAIRNDGTSPYLTTNWTVLMDDVAARYVIDGDTVKGVNSSSGVKSSSGVAPQGVNSSATGVNSRSVGNEPQFREGVNSSSQTRNRGSSKPPRAIRTHPHKPSENRARDALASANEDEGRSAKRKVRRGVPKPELATEQPSATEQGSVAAPDPSGDGRTPLERLEAEKATGIHESMGPEIRMQGMRELAAQRAKAKT